MLGMSPLISALITLFIIAIVAGIVLWLISIAPFLTPPIKQFLTFAVYAICAIFLIVFLLSLVGVVSGDIFRLGSVRAR